MSSNRKTFYEEMHFNDYAYAMDKKRESEELLEQSGQIRLLAIIGTVCGLLSFMGVTAIAAFAISILCYQKIGGFSVAARWAKNLAVWGWIIAPFPFDLITFPIVFIYAFLALLFLPYFVVHSYRKQLRKTIDEADEYLKYCEPRKVVYEE